MICGYCGDGELKPSTVDPTQMQCSACGRGGDADLVEDVAARREADDEDNQARQAFFESTRKRAPGGGDDGLRLTVMRPLGDETFVSAKTEVIEPKSVVFQVTNVECKDSAEARDALADWFLDPPTPEDAFRLLAEFHGVVRS